MAAAWQRLPPGPLPTQAEQYPYISWVSAAAATHMWRHEEVPTLSLHLRKCLVFFPLSFSSSVGRFYSRYGNTRGRGRFYKLMCLETHTSTFRTSQLDLIQRDSNKPAERVVRNSHRWHSRFGNDHTLNTLQHFISSQSGDKSVINAMGSWHKVCVNSFSEPELNMRKSGWVIHELDGITGAVETHRREDVLSV